MKQTLLDIFDGPGVKRLLNKSSVHSTNYPQTREIHRAKDGSGGPSAMC